MHSTAWPINSVAVKNKSKTKSPTPYLSLIPRLPSQCSHTYLCAYMCICIVQIYCANSFSYRYTQHISSCLLANAFARESPMLAQALFSQTRQDSYSAQPPQKRAPIIVVGAGRKYCHAGRCHSLSTRCLLQHLHSPEVRV